MSKQLKKLISLLLAALLVLGMVPAAAAAGPAQEPVSAPAPEQQPEGEEIFTSNAPEASDRPDDAYVYTDEDYALIEADVFARIDGVKAEAARTMGGEGKMTEQDYTDLIPSVITAIESSDTYVTGSLQQNGGLLIWQTTAGIPCCYSPRMEAKHHNTDREPDPAELAQEEEFLARADELLAQLEDAEDTRGGKPTSVKIGLIQPYWESSTNYADKSFLNYSPNYKKMMEKLAAATGGGSMRYSMKNATVDNIAKTLQQCGLVIFDSHGSTDYEGSNDDFTSRANTSYLCLITSTGITSTDTKAQSGTYGTYYHCLKGSSYCFVDGTCISNHMTKSAPHSLLYMGICLGMATKGMFQPLRSKGVETVWGYSQSVTFSGEQKYMWLILGMVLGGDNFKNAVASAKSYYGNWDPAYSSYTEAQARANKVAFPVCVSSEDAYPGQGNVDKVQTVNSTWSLYSPTWSGGLQFSSSPVYMNVGDQLSVTVTGTGKLPMFWYLSYNNSNSSSVSASWGSWNSDGVSIPLNLEGLSPGYSQLTIRLYQDNTAQTLLATKVLDVYVRFDAYYDFSGYYLMFRHAASSGFMTNYTRGACYGPTEAERDPALYWTTEQQSDGSFLIINEYDGGVLTLTEDGTLALKQYRDDSKSQKWRFAQFGEGIFGIVCEYRYYLITVNNTSYGAMMTASTSVNQTTQGFTAYQAVDGSGNLYSRPSKPAAPSFTYFTRSGNQVSFGWTQSPVNGNWDERLYCVDAYDNDWNLIYSTFTANTFASFNCDPAPTIHVHITALNGLYDSFLVDYGHSDEAVWISYGTNGDLYNPFIDVTSDDWFYNPVIWAYYHNPQITDGVDENIFGPYQNCTRAQVVTFLWRAAGCPKPSVTKNPFSDVSSSDWYYQPVLWAVGAGITDGVDDTHFAPGDSCTRAQVVTFLWRANGSVSVTGVTNRFVDVKKTDWFYKAVLWAVKNGVTDGVDDTHFAPTQTCTRAQVVTFLYRVY